MLNERNKDLNLKLREGIEKKGPFSEKQGLEPCLVGWKRDFVFFLLEEWGMRSRSFHKSKATNLHLDTISRSHNQVMVSPTREY